MQTEVPADEKSGTAKITDPNVMMWTNWYRQLPRHIGSHADAAKLYDSIVPFKSKYTEGLDVRPLGMRRRYYDRIHKLSDGSYTLHGWSWPCPKQVHSMGETYTDDDLRETALMRWEADDRLYIQGKNYWDLPSATLLHRVLPAGLRAKQAYVRGYGSSLAIKVQLADGAKTVLLSRGRLQSARLHSKCYTTPAGEGQTPLILRRAPDRLGCWVIEQEPSLTITSGTPDKAWAKAHKAEVDGFVEWVRGVVLPVFGPYSYPEWSKAVNPLTARYEGAGVLSWVLRDGAMRRQIKRAAGSGAMEGVRNMAIAAITGTDEEARLVMARSLLRSARDNMTVSHAEPITAETIDWGVYRMLATGLVWKPLNFKVQA